MKIGVLGTGAVGGYFGGRLANAGHDVTFIARSKTLEAIKQRGLRIDSYTGNFVLKNPVVTSDLRALQGKDLIFVCVKSYGTKEIAQKLKSVVSPNTLVISLQNGVDNEDILADVLGYERVIGSVVFLTSSTPEPGLIKHTSYGKITLGELNGQTTDRLNKLEELFLKAGIPAGKTISIKKELWKKLMLNVPYNGFTALVRSSLKNYDEIEEAKESFERAVREVQQVARAEGFDIDEKDVENVLSFTKHENFTSFKSSTLLDVEIGKPVEIEAMHGAVIRAAKRHNVDIPVNKVVYSLLKMSYR